MFNTKIKEIDKLYMEQQYQQALEQYMQLTEQFNDLNLEQCAQLNLAIADCHYSLKNIEEALQYFMKTLLDEDMQCSSYVNFKLGMCLHELGDVGKAKFYLLKAYEIDGEQAFSENENMIKLIEEII